MESQKITNSRQAAPKRRYDDACGTAHALDLVGERWALLVMRELMLGPKRFSDLRADLPGISANVLTQRLEGLETSGLLLRRKLPPPASTQVYELTEWGYEAEDIILAMGRWATRSPLHDPTQQVSSTSIMLSFRAMFRPERAEGMSARIGFRLGHETLVATIEDGTLRTERGETEGADVVFTGTPETLAAAVYGKQPLDILAEAGMLQTTGDRAVAERFVTLFSLPPKVGCEGEFIPS
jgi:DNA-binding HxlR family transcriptional regulator